MSEATVRQLAHHMSTASIAKHGDRWERGASGFLAASFPNYERFWRTFVLPYRKSRDSVIIRTDLPRSHEAVCIYNYSVMRTCVRLHSFWREAQRRVETEGDTGSDVFEDFFIRTKTGIDQVRQFVCCTYVALVKKELRSDVKIMDWTQDRIKGDAHAWLSNLGDRKLRRRLDEFEEKISRYRNQIIHGPKWPGREDRVPKPENVHGMLYWSDWAVAMDDEQKWLNDTTDRFTVISEIRIAFLSLVNDMWGEMVDSVLAMYGSQSVINSSFVFVPLEQVSRGMALDLPSLADVSSSASTWDLHISSQD